MSARIYPYPHITDSAADLQAWGETMLAAGYSGHAVTTSMRARIMQEPRIFSPTGLANWQLANGEFTDHARVVYLDALIARKKKA